MKKAIKKAFIYKVDDKHYGVVLNSVSNENLSDFTMYIKTVLQIHKKIEFFSSSIVLNDENYNKSFSSYSERYKTMSVK